MDFDPESVRAFERAGWERAAGTYEAAFATATRQFIDPLLDAVGPAASLLDLCCGPGFVAAAARDRGAAASGLDFSPAMLAVARARFPGIAFEAGDAEAMPFAAATFDAVASNFGIHHVPRPGVALTEVWRVLRPGGFFAFTIWAGTDDNIAWKLIFDAIRVHGDLGASNAPPAGGGFSTAAHCLDALKLAGFGDTRAVLARRVWRHADAASFVESFRAGTARMAALIAAQKPADLPAIQAAIEETAAPWREEAASPGRVRVGLAVPIAAIVASGTKR